MNEWVEGSLIAFVGLQKIGGGGDKVEEWMNE